MPATVSSVVPRLTDRVVNPCTVNAEKRVIWDILYRVLYDLSGLKVHFDSWLIATDSWWKGAVVIPHAQPDMAAHLSVDQ